MVSKKNRFFRIMRIISRDSYGSNESDEIDQLSIYPHGDHAYAPFSIWNIRYRIQYQLYKYSF